MKKVITWAKPTGEQLHIGNLLGAVLPFWELAKNNDAAIFVADLHALNQITDAKTLRHNIEEIPYEYLAILGLDTPFTIFRQSEIHGIPMLNWILNNVTPFSLMARAHSYKDFQQGKEENILLLGQYEWRKIANQDTLNFIDNFKKNNGISDSNKINDYTYNFLVSYINYLNYSNNEITTNLEKQTLKLKQVEFRFENSLNMWTFNYPILMAADIIGYDIDIVPVGKDQKQHVEMARDIAKSFNKTYKEDFFVIPKEHIGKDIGTIPGLDGRKMSKSYGNTIGVFDDEKTLKKKVMSIPTDSTPLEEPKNPDTCNVFNLVKFFGKKNEVETIRGKYLAWGYGYWHAKLDLLGILLEYLRPYQERYAYLRNNPDIVEKRLSEWAKIMNARMDKKIDELQKIIGIR